MNYLPCSSDTDCFRVNYSKSLYTICTLAVILGLIIILFYHFKGASPEIASAARGENVVLPCFNSTVMDQKSCYRVRLFVTDDKQVLFARPKSPKFPDDKRIKWQADKNGKMSLYLTKLQESDVRSYTCEICKGWDCAHVKTISVKIKGKITDLILLILTLVQIHHLNLPSFRM